MFTSIMVSSLQTVEAFNTAGCDQVFSSAQLRYGYNYRFWDDYTNQNSYKHQVYDVPVVSVEENHGDYNGTPSVP
jgi:hypothetical protein